ncbi:MAG: TraR/DksA C4-type zinc finger protein [Pseudomonadota bacterium]
MGNKKEFDATDFDIAENEFFTKEELISFLKVLVDEKDKLLEKTKSTLNAGTIQLDSNEMMDEVDLAAATVEQNLSLRLLDRDNQQLAEIEHAIAKIGNGEFGLCEGTGEPIPKRRLELSPWTRYSVKHKEKLEKSRKVGRGANDDEPVF